MSVEDEVWFYGKSTSATDVIAETTPLFKLKTKTVKYDLGRTITPQKVPGAEYAKAYDAEVINGSITLTGEFVGADATWDGANFIGRPFDFIHYLKCFANGLDPATGDQLTSATYNCYSILIKQTFKNTARSYAPGIVNNVIKNYYAIGKVSFDLDGKMSRTVGWTLPLTEVSDVVNMKRV